MACDLLLLDSPFIPTLAATLTRPVASAVVDAERAQPMLPYALSPLVGDDASSRHIKVLGNVLVSQRTARLLAQARACDTPPGSVKELHLKHLLALNLRKLGGEEMAFVPRSYVLQLGNYFEDEFRDFEADFKRSQAVAVLRHLAAFDDALHEQQARIASAKLPTGDLQPEGSWGRQQVEVAWQPGPDTSLLVGIDCVTTALVVAQRVVKAAQQKLDMPVVTQHEWSKIRGFSPSAPWAFDVASTMDALRLEVAALLEALPAEFQADLIHRNLWVMKPSCGQFGRGILILDRLPESTLQLLQWTVSVGRGGLKSGKDEREGCVLQKLVERPHLLDQHALVNLSRGSVALERAAPARLFKYNFRIWVVAALRAPPSVWLYREGYVSLAMNEFTAAPDARSHITNLRGEGAGGTGRAMSSGEDYVQRRWSLTAFAAHLDQSRGANTYAGVVWPQVKGVVCKLFRALGAPPDAALAPEGSETGRRLRRFGVDLLVDSALRIWLVEVNILKDGYALGYAPKGAAGDDKRRLVQEFLRDEKTLRIAAKEGGGGGQIEHGDIGDLAAFEQLLPP